MASEIVAIETLLQPFSLLNGNVGIGTASQSCTLDVIGSIRASGNSTGPTTGEGLENVYSSGIGYIAAYDRSGSLYKNLHINGLTLTLNENSGGDVYTNVWADYSALSTIVGFSAFSTKFIYTKKVGKTVYVEFRLIGTGNATTMTFTLPYPAAVSSVRSLLATDAGTELPTAMLAIFTGSQSVACYTTQAGAGWTSSGVRAVQGGFNYQAA